MMELEGEWGAVAAGPEPAPRPPVPWEDLRLSGPEGFFRTLRDLLFRPGEFFDNLGREGWAEPLAFALIVSSAGLLGALFWQLLVLAPTGLNPGEALRLSPSLDLGAAGLLAMMAGAPVLVLVDLGVGSLCWWGRVALVGADRDFTPAWRILCYAQGGMVLGVIPLFGMLLAGIWVLALLYCGVKQVYGISAWGALGVLAIFLSLQALLGLILVVGLTAAAALLGFLMLLG
jgi:hypothetical protein